MSDWTRIVLLGIFLAVIVFVVFFYEAGVPAGGGGVKFVTPRVKTPVIDDELLAQAKDGTRHDRLVLEPEPLAHLLEKSLQVTPSVAKALGMPSVQVPIGFLRASPDKYRGQYLWYKGELKHISDGMPGHPVPNRKIHEGWIETDEGDEVLFRVSLPPTDLAEGDYVRIEGFFMKLRDSNLSPKTDLAPLLVGPELFPEFRAWESVEQLDPSILARVNDGVWEGPMLSDEGDTKRHLIDSQDVPLWHLASYARNQRDAMGQVEWRTKVPAFSKEGQFEAMKRGQVERGTRMRVLGTFIMAQTYEASPNPAGIDYWSQVWVQIPLASKLVPVWIPDKVSALWQRNVSVEVRGYYYRGYAYETESDEQRWTPIFVADQLDAFESLPAHPVVGFLKWGFMILVLAVIALFIGIARRDRKRQELHEEQMVNRRRKRRQLATMGSDA